MDLPLNQSDSTLHRNSNWSVSEHFLISCFSANLSQHFFCEGESTPAPLHSGQTWSRALRIADLINSERFGIACRISRRFGSTLNVTVSAFFNLYLRYYIISPIFVYLYTFYAKTDLTASRKELTLIMPFSSGKSQDPETTNLLKPNLLPSAIRRAI